MRYAESNQQSRLTGQLTPRGGHPGLSTGGALLFGLPFVGAGVGIAGVGLKAFPVDPASVHAPYWVLTVFGVCFFSAGLLLWSMAIRQFILNRRRAQTSGGGPEAVALADYAWDPRGDHPSRWRRVGKALLLAIALTTFLSIFNWWAFFSKEGPLPLKVIVILFDLILAVLWGSFFLTLARAFRFSDSRIDFVRFPYAIAQPIVIRWQVPHGISQPVRGSFTLRCVEEWWETSGSGKNRSRHLIKEARWSGTWELESGDQLLGANTQEFTFAPAPDASPTNLSAAKPIYWEFEVKLEMAGPDFVETYLVPVYQ